MRSIILGILVVSGIVLTSCTSDTSDAEIYETDAIRKDEFKNRDT